MSIMQMGTHLYLGLLRDNLEQISEQNIVGNYTPSSPHFPGILHSPCIKMLGGRANLGHRKERENEERKEYNCQQYSVLKSALDCPVAAPSINVCPSA